MLTMLYAFQLAVIVFYLTVYISMRRILGQIENVNSQIKSGLGKSSRSADNVHKSLVVERVSMAEL